MKFKLPSFIETFVVKMAAAVGQDVPALPKVLVLGGIGFIGRNFVDYLVTNNLVSITQSICFPTSVTSSMLVLVG